MKDTALNGLKDGLIGSLPILPFIIGLGVYIETAKAEVEPPPIAIVEVVEEEIEIVFIRPPTQEEIERARAYNLANPL